MAKSQQVPSGLLKHDLQVPFYLQLKKLYGPVIKIVGSEV